MIPALSLNDPSSVAIKNSIFHDIHFTKSQTAGVNISAHKRVVVESSAFVNLRSIYESEVSLMIGPALHLAGTICSVSKSCFISCYGPSSSAFIISSFCIKFDQNALIRCGFADGVINEHPSFFMKCKVEKLSYYNASNCAREMIYFYLAEAVSIIDSTISGTLADTPISNYKCNSSYFLSRIVVTNDLNMYQYASKDSYEMTLKSSIFIGNVTYISNNNITFDNCFFGHDIKDLEKAKGNAILIKCKTINKGNIVLHRINAECPFALSGKIQKKFLKLFTIVLYIII